MLYFTPGYITAFVGFMGAGKTLNQTRLLQKAHLVGLATYANYDTTFAYRALSELQVLGPEEPIKSPHDPRWFDGRPIADSTPPLESTFRGGVIAMDEFHFTLDSRDFARNASLSRDLVLLRKRGIALFYSVQYFEMIDRRVRDQTRFVLYHDLIPGGKASVVKVYRLDYMIGTHLNTYRLNFLPRIQHLYDTHDMSITLIPRPKKQKDSRNKSPRPDAAAATGGAAASYPLPGGF